MSAFEAGREAFAKGKTEADNPYLFGKTKLGAPKFSDREAGCDWHNGWLSAKPMRIASAKEMAAARSVDVRNYRAKKRNYYC